MWLMNVQNWTVEWPAGEVKQWAEKCFKIMYRWGELYSWLYFFGLTTGSNTFRYTYWVHWKYKIYDIWLEELEGEEHKSKGEQTLTRQQICNNRSIPLQGNRAEETNLILASAEHYNACIQSLSTYIWHVTTVVRYLKQSELFLYIKDDYLLELDFLLRCLNVRKMYHWVHSLLNFSWHYKCKSDLKTYFDVTVCLDKANATLLSVY